MKSETKFNTGSAPLDHMQPVAYLRSGENEPVQNVPLGAMWITDKDDPRGFPVYASPPVDHMPVMYVSEQQLCAVGDYLPTRKEAEGNFQLALYRQPAPAPIVDAPDHHALAARYRRLHAVCARILWADIGIPAMDSEQTKAAMTEISEIVLMDALIAVGATHAVATEGQIGHGAPAPTDIFVFGSNLAGRHGAGAAAFARRNHGAIYGQGIGLQGQSYGIPTKDRSIKTLPLAVISGHVSDFLEFARSRADLTFCVTPIGCGLAGYKRDEIRPMFEGMPPNCRFAATWEDVI